jgi:hypothetical protein
LRTEHDCDDRRLGTAARVDAERYGELTDESEQMHSAEAPPAPGSIFSCGAYMKSILIEMVRYLVTRN